MDLTDITVQTVEQCWLFHWSMRVLTSCPHRLCGHRDRTPVNHAYAFLVPEKGFLDGL